MAASLRRASPGARLEAAALAALPVVALALRSWGTGFGLPHRYHPDEFQYVEDAIGFLDGDPSPERLNNPTGHKAFLAVQYALLGRLVGRPGDDAAELAPYYRLGRWNSALLGAASVPVVWWLGRRAYGPSVGWLAALFLTVAFLPVRESHFATNDASVTWLATLALAFALHAGRAPSPARSLAAGLTAGAATAVKYTGALLALPLALAHLLPALGARAVSARRPAIAGLALALGAMAAAYLAGNPYTLLDRPLFVQDVIALIGRGQHGYKGQVLDPAGGYVFFLRVLSWSLGPALLALALAGVARALLRPTRADLVLVAYALAVYVFHARQLMFFARFVLPAVPVLLVLAARALDELARRAVADERRRRIALGALGLALALPPTIASVRLDWLLCRTDTRTLALEWITANVPAGSAIVSEPYGPPLDDGRYRLEVTDSEGLTWRERDLETYRRSGVGYLVTSSFVYERAYVDREQTARRRRFYAQLAAEDQLLAEFRPYPGPTGPPFEFTQVYGPVTDLFALDRPGPVIRVYRLAPPSSAPSSARSGLATTQAYPTPSTRATNAGPGASSSRAPSLPVCTSLT